MTAPATSVNPNMTVKRGDSAHTIFMSFALLNRLTRHLGNLDELPLLSINPELQETIILEVFTVRDKSGNPTDVPSNLEEIDVSLDDMDKVLNFVGDHIANFFTRSAENAAKRMKKIHEKVTALSN